MENFTPIASAAGGALIGVSASIMLLATGRITGISGILGGLGRPARGDASWRLAFLAGLLAGGVLLALARPEALAFELDRSWGAMALAGLLVGFGSRLGGGCTSGHGVCGLSRLSTRSLVATMTVMATGVAIAAIVTNLMGGAL
jgi:uncharacterized protein